MNLRINTLRLLILPLAAAFSASACSAQVGHFAVATGGSNIYLVRAGASWPSMGSVATLYSAGVGFAGVAVSGNWVFAADKSANRLVIGRIDNVLSSPSLSNVRTVDLASGQTPLSKPSAVAVDDAGGVYVIGSEKTGGVSRYAYVTAEGGDWTRDITVSYGVGMDAVLADVSALPGGRAIIANDKTFGTIPRVTHTTKVTGQTHLLTRVVGADPNDPSSSYASAVAVLQRQGQSALAYVLSKVGLAGADIYGTLDVIDTDDLSTLATYRLDRNFYPEDVAVLNLGATSYLTLIGRPRNQADNSAEAWRIALTNGLPDLDSVKTFRWQGENVGGQRCAVSENGLVFWSTHPGVVGQPTVSALDTGSWNAQLWDLSATAGLGIGNICAFDYNYVPEPASIAFLITGLTVGGALLKRGRR